MKYGRIIVFTILLIVLTTACKFFFGSNLAWSGFSPIIAIALFSGFAISQKDISFIFPLLALILSDTVIQFFYEKGLFAYPGFYTGQLWNYLILLSATTIGFLLKGKAVLSNVVGIFVAPTVFFLLSNFNVWLTQEITYEKTFAGLMQSYTNGLPFYRNSLIATAVFLPIILFSYNYITRSKPSLVIA